MTKSEFQQSIDRIMDRYEANIRSEIRAMEERINRQFLKIDHRHNWIIGLVITSGIVLGSMLLKFLSQLSG